jgi:hypothetical protein
VSSTHVACRALACLAAVVLLLAACVPSPTGASQTATPTATTVTTAPATPTSSPAPTSDPTAAAFFKTLTAGWRPTTTTLIVSEVVPTGQAAALRIVAVPADGSAATPLVSLEGAPLIAVRADGSAVAAAVGGGVAMWEPTGLARWLVQPDLSTLVTGPVWSPDGATLYFGRMKTTPGTFGGDLGLFRVRADGSGLEKVLGPEPPGQLPPLISVARAVPADNLLVWGRAYEGATLEIRDLATGRGRTYDGGVAELFAWRSTQPRALIQHCSNTGCRGLLEWNDETGAKQQLLSDDVEVRGADRDPAASRIVVARRTDAWGLDVVDGGATTRIPGTANAQWPRWLSTGIAYLWGPAEGGIGVSPLPELRIIPPAGGTPRTLYRAAAPETTIFVIQIVRR